MVVFCALPIIVESFAVEYRLTADGIERRFAGDSTTTVTAHSKGGACCPRSLGAVAAQQTGRVAIPSRHGTRYRRWRIEFFDLRPSRFTDSDEPANSDAVPIEDQMRRRSHMRSTGWRCENTRPEHCYV